MLENNKPSATTSDPSLATRPVSTTTARRRFRWMDSAGNATLTNTTATREPNATKTSKRSAAGRRFKRGNTTSSESLSSWPPRRASKSEKVQRLTLAEGKKEEETPLTKQTTKLDPLAVNPYDGLVRWQQTWFTDDRAATDDTPEEFQKDGVRILKLAQSKDMESESNQASPRKRNVKERQRRTATTTSQGDDPEVKVPVQGEIWFPNWFLGTKDTPTRRIQDKKRREKELKQGADVNKEPPQPRRKVPTSKIPVKEPAAEDESADKETTSVDEPKPSRSSPWWSKPTLEIQSSEESTKDDGVSTTDPNESPAETKSDGNANVVSPETPLDLDLLEDNATQEEELEDEPMEDLVVEKLELAETSSTAKTDDLAKQEESKGKADQPTELDRNETIASQPMKAPASPERTNVTTATAAPPAVGVPSLFGVAPQQSQQPSMIVLSAPPEYPRGMPPPGARRVTQHTTPSTSAILIEALASIISASLRIWFLTSLTKWWQQEESMEPVQHFVWERLNDRYSKDETALKTILQAPPPGVSERKWRWQTRKQQRHERKARAASGDPKSTELKTNFDRTVVVMELGDNEKEQLNFHHLQQAVTFLLSQHRQKAFGTHNTVAKRLEVVILVESPGGVVQDFGLAASQVRRLSSEPGISTTVCVDKMAASGGYMVASQAETLVVAPFAIVGSIGVIREGLNFHEVLQKHGIEPLTLKAGKAKVPITTLGKVTKQDVKTAQKTLDTMHDAFQQLVADGRPMLRERVDDVCNGDIYLGQEALSLSLADRVATSEEYLLERIQAGDRVLKLHKSHQHYYARHRRLFSPLDLISEKSGIIGKAWGKLRASEPLDWELIISRLVTATSAAGFAKYLVQVGYSFRSEH